MSAETKRANCYRHYIGHVYAGGHTNVDIWAADGADGRQVEISRTYERKTHAGSIKAEAAAQIADVLAAIDDWDELNALVKLMRAAATYEPVENTPREEI